MTLTHLSRPNIETRLFPSKAQTDTGTGTGTNLNVPIWTCLRQMIQDSCVRSPLQLFMPVFYFVNLITKVPPHSLVEIVVLIFTRDINRSPPIHISSHGIKSSILEKPEISTTNWYDKTGDQQPDAKPTIHPHHRHNVIARFLKSLEDFIANRTEEPKSSNASYIQSYPVMKTPCSFRAFTSTPRSMST
jgi:hypothetical protein